MFAKLGVLLLIEAGYLAVRLLNRPLVVDQPFWLEIAIIVLFKDGINIIYVFVWIFILDGYAIYEFYTCIKNSYSTVLFWGKA